MKKEKAILIKCVERQITTTQYENVDMAFRAMEEDLAKEMNIDAIPENWNDVDVYDRQYDFDIDSNNAWLTTNNNYDWHIEKI